jgi:hypothetical protein
MTRIPARYSNGVNTLERPVAALRDLRIPFRRNTVSKADHFVDFVPSAWTVTETQAGATQAVTGAIGGVLLLANSAADNDVNQIQGPEAYKLQAVKVTKFEARVKLSEVIQADLFVGLSILDADLVGGVTDFIGFRKDDGDALLDFVCLKDSVGSNSVGLATLVNDAWVSLGFVFNGVDISVYIDSQRAAVIKNVVFPDDEELAVTFSITNGEAVAKNLSIDYYVVEQEI